MALALCAITDTLWNKKAVYYIVIIFFIIFLITQVLRSLLK